MTTQTIELSPAQAGVVRDLTEKVSRLSGAAAQARWERDRLLETVALGHVHASFRVLGYDASTGTLTIETESPESPET